MTLDRDIVAARANIGDEQFSLTKILTIWALAAVPMPILAYGATPSARGARKPSHGRGQDGRPVARDTDLGKTGQEDVQRAFLVKIVVQTNQAKFIKETEYGFHRRWKWQSSTQAIVRSRDQDSCTSSSGFAFF